MVKYGRTGDSQFKVHLKNLQEIHDAIMSPWTTKNLFYTGQDHGGTEVYPRNNGHNMMGIYPVWDGMTALHTHLQACMLSDNLFYPAHLLFLEGGRTLEN